jgi:Family of unknown function (DUF6186)
VSSHDITIAGYLALLAAAVVLQVLGAWTRAPVPTLGEVISRAMRTRTGRIGVLVAWAWLGLHFSAR